MNILRIPLVNETYTGSNYSYSWNHSTVTIQHEFGKRYFYQLLDIKGGTVICPARARDGSLEITFPRPFHEDESFQLDLINPTKAECAILEITNQDSNSISWNDNQVEVKHAFGTRYTHLLTGSDGTVFVLPAKIGNNLLTLEFPEPLTEGISCELRLFSLDTVAYSTEIEILSGNQLGTDWEYSWNQAECQITHSAGQYYAFYLLDPQCNLIATSCQVRENQLTLDFNEALLDTESYRLVLYSTSFWNTNTALQKLTEVQEADATNDPEFKYYSGRPENILAFCKTLHVSDDRLASLHPQDIEKYQRFVDEAIDGYLEEYYFTPIVPFNRVDSQGIVHKEFPGKLRLLAIQWTAGLLLQSEFQNLEPNTHEAARTLAEDALHQMQQFTDFGITLPGQKRQNPLPTMPPNLAPSRTMEYYN